MQIIHFLKWNILNLILTWMNLSNHQFKHVDKMWFFSAFVCYKVLSILQWTGYHRHQHMNLFFWCGDTFFCTKSEVKKIKELNKYLFFQSCWIAIKITIKMTAARWRRQEINFSIFGVQAAMRARVGFETHAWFVYTRVRNVNKHSQKTAFVEDFQTNIRKGVVFESIGLIKRD